MSKLFEAAKIGSMDVKNRFIRSATWEELADEYGHLTPELTEVYRKLAEGGVGTIITSFAYTNPGRGPVASRMLGIYEDRFIPELADLTELIHGYGTRIILQLGQGGDDATMNTMTTDEIKTAIDQHVQGAVRAKAAGFDGIQFHFAHGIWSGRFLTPAFNHRTDEYGGSFENRTRVLYELYDKTRAAVGPDFQIWIKINASDYLPEGGFTLEECKAVCAELDRRGMDLIEISGENGTCRPNETWRSGINAPEKEAYFGRDAAEIANLIQAPVACVGGIRSLPVMERLVQSGVRFVSISRPFLSEPDLVNKLAAGATKSRCISCNCCFEKPGKPCILDQRKA